MNTDGKGGQGAILARPLGTGGHGRTPPATGSIAKKDRGLMEGRGIRVDGGREGGGRGRSGGTERTHHVSSVCDLTVTLEHVLDPVLTDA